MPAPPSGKQRAGQELAARGGVRGAATKLAVGGKRLRGLCTGNKAGTVDGPVAKKRGTAGAWLIH